MKDKKCILLVRVSTDSQSYDAQEAELYELAQNDGYSKDQIVSISYKESGIKLKEEERLGLQKMYDLIATKEYDCVYAWEISRIARTKKVLFSVQEKLLKNKIQLIIKNPSLKLLKDNGDIDEGAEIIFTLFAQLAEAEMRNKKDRFSRGKRQKASEGKYAGANLPYGYKVDYNNDKKIIIDEEQSKVVIEVYNLYEEGFSQTKIPMELEKRGFPRITISLISHILKNESYTGKENKEKKMKGQGGRGDWTKYPRKYPPIISTEQFERCRKIAETRNTQLYAKTSRSYYAANLIFCPECGGKWAGNSHNTSYRCYISHLPAHVYEYGNYKSKGKQCQNKTYMSINILDSLLWQIAVDEEFKVRLEDNDTEISMLSDDVSSKTISLNNLQKLLEDNASKREKAGLLYIDGILSKETYEKKLVELENNKISIEQEIVSIRSYISQIELKIQRYQSKKSLVPIIPKLKEILSNEQYDKATEILELSKSIQQEIAELQNTANDIVRYNLVQEHIEKVLVEPVSFSYRHKTKRLGNGIVKGKLIKVYTYSQALNSLKGDNPSQYPYYYVSVTNDGFGGKTMFKYLKYDYEIAGFDKENIDLYNGDFLPFELNKIDRFVCERKIQKRKKEKELREHLHSSPEYIKMKEEEKMRKIEERKKKAREYAKMMYWKKKSKND